jgi:hexosaminidase
MPTRAIDLIPEPQSIILGADTLRLPEQISIALPGKPSDEDRFAADDLASLLHSMRGIGIAESAAFVIELLRSTGPPEGYKLTVTRDGIRIEGNDAAGLYWGTRTLWQIVESGGEIPCMTIEDWPDLALRAIHYDTKHHQDTYEYVQDFIRTLARYKINTLVWEWEDKFAYERHPEVAAPGALTKTQMQQLTAFARWHHVQIVPLVQGLGHASYILKHPQHKPLREIPDSNWEFCVLRAGTYELLFDLWDEAMEATPGSEYLHIGSDETYELGLGENCGCKAKAEEIGKDGLMGIFIDKCVAHVESRGRRAMSWGGRYRAGADYQTPKGMIFVDSSDVEYLAEAKRAGYDTLAYAPNPGIEPLFLGYLPWVQCSMWREDPVRSNEGCFRRTGATIQAAGQAGVVLGSITTSWDDSGLHNQAWMPRFICAAEYSWSSRGPDVDVFIDRYMREYFGQDATHMRELFQLMQDGALFYYDTFQRKVWHWGDVGKVHLPDLPRVGAEYSPFWRRRYSGLLKEALAERQRMARALAIIDANLVRGTRHPHDLEIFRTCVELMRHNVDLVLMLGDLEAQIGAAHSLHYSDRRRALGHLRNAQSLVQDHLADRESVFTNLVSVWEQTRLPKGYATSDKPFVHEWDRARHFANRTPDMRYLIFDEELLDLEGYLDKLTAYTADYEATL